MLSIEKCAVKQPNRQTTILPTSKQADFASHKCILGQNYIFLHCCCCWFCCINICCNNKYKIFVSQTRKLATQKKKSSSHTHCIFTSHRKNSTSHIFTYKYILFKRVFLQGPPKYLFFLENALIFSIFFFLFGSTILPVNNGK